jgi:hypothetical protein
MNRQDLQQLSRARKRDAQILLGTGNYAGSYYLMGYSVECAIKAVIAKQTQRYDFPDKRLAYDSWSHDLKHLFQTAGLWRTFESTIKTNTSLSVNWSIVKDWTENSRYTLAISQQQAQDMFSACTARTHGLLSWIKNYW